MSTRAEWQAMLERQIGARPTRIARNQAITLCYARWYLQEPWLFKWAGMAAFASAQVGTALAVADLVESPHGMVRAKELVGQTQTPAGMASAPDSPAIAQLLSFSLMLHDAATRPLLLNDLELIRQANDAIFNDIGWAHLAYLNQGLPAIEDCMDPAQQADLLSAFRMLDQGAHLMCNPDDMAAGANLIQQASITMLRHEQMTILPPFMEQMSNQGRLLASFGSWLDFEGAPGLLGQPSFSGYYGPLAVLLGQRSICNADDRWQWIEQNVLTVWAQLDAAYSEDGPLHRRLAAMANETPTMLQQTVGLLDRVYPALAPKGESGAKRERMTAITVE
jgi:hypothetical protein